MNLRISLLAAPLAICLAAVPLSGTLHAQAQEASVLKVSWGSLENLDPIWTTAGQTRYHAFLVYDFLFGLDEDNNVQPQMVDTHTVSDDGLAYSFTLRDGLMFHNGDPVTATDVVASLTRWGKKDGTGVEIFSRTAELVAVDDKTFTWTLNKPFGKLVHALGKVTPYVPIIVPEALAATDPAEQMPEVIGSGPFRFVAEEWVPNALAVYERFDGYVPRSEPPSMFAGGKIVYIDRIEAPYIGDVQTNMAALQTGEIDYTVNTQYDLLPILDADPNVVTSAHDDTGLLGIIRLNHLHPPFSDPRAREAMQLLVDQKQYLHAIAGNEAYYDTCGALFGCGTINGTEGNSETLMSQNLERATELFQEAGYDGSPVVILHRIDHPREKGAGEVTAQLLRQAGINVDLQEMDWGTVTTRRAMMEPPADGGWNIFHTAGAGIVMDDPLFILNRTSCDNAWYGWPCDEEYEKLAAAYADAMSAEESLSIAAQMQNRGMDVVVQIPYGTLFSMVAYRVELEGVLKARGGYPLWNIRKE